MTRTVTPDQGDFPHAHVFEVQVKQCYGRRLGKAGNWVQTRNYSWSVLVEYPYGNTGYLRSFPKMAGYEAKQLAARVPDPVSYDWLADNGFETLY